MTSRIRPCCDGSPVQPGSMAFLLVYRPETGDAFLTKLEVEAQ